MTKLLGVLLWQFAVGVFLGGVADQKPLPEHQEQEVRCVILLLLQFLRDFLHQLGFEFGENTVHDTGERFAVH